MARALAMIGTRRGLIGTSLAATGLGLAGVTISEEALARKKRRRR